MGKARINSRGYTLEQQLKKENQQLKQQISQLRKQLARVDLDRYDTVKEIIEQHYQQEKAEQGKEILENLKKTWACTECGDGHLEIFIYNRGNETFYYRICSNAPGCMNRTKSQKYDPTAVKGIIRKDKGNRKQA
jgi:hypothetical protein